MAKLVAEAPHELLERPISTGEVFVHPVDSFSKRKSMIWLSSATEMAESKGPIPHGGAMPRDIGSFLSQASSAPQQPTTPLKSGEATPSSSTPGSKRRIVIDSDNSDDEEDATAKRQATEPTAAFTALAHAAAPMPACSKLGRARSCRHARTSSRTSGGARQGSHHQVAARPRARHDPRCVRNRWSHDSALAFAPEVGEQVRMMQSAGAFAGKWFKFKGPSSKDWMPVELDDSD